MDSTQLDKLALNAAIVKNYHQIGKAKIDETSDIILEAFKNLVVRQRSETGTNDVTQIKRLIEYHFNKLHQNISVDRNLFFKQAGVSDESMEESGGPEKESPKVSFEFDYITVQKVLNKPKVDSSSDITDGIARSMLRCDPDLRAFELQSLKITSGKSRCCALSFASLKNGDLLVTDWTGTTYEVKQDGSSQTAVRVPISLQNSQEVRVDRMRPCSIGFLILDKQMRLLFAQKSRVSPPSSYDALRLFTALERSQVLKFYSVHESDEEFEGKDLIHVFALVKLSADMTENKGGNQKACYRIVYQRLERQPLGFKYLVADEGRVQTFADIYLDGTQVFLDSDFHFTHFIDNGLIQFAFAFRDGSSLTVGRGPVTNSIANPSDRRNWDILNFPKDNPVTIVSSHYQEALKRWVFLTRQQQKQDMQNAFVFFEYDIVGKNPFLRGPEFTFDEAYKSLVKTGNVSAVHLFEQKTESKGGAAEYVRRFFILTESGFYTSGNYDSSSIQTAKAADNDNKKPRAAITLNTSHQLAAHHQVSDSFVQDGVFRAVFMPRSTNQADLNKEGMGDSILLSYRFDQHTEDN